MEYYLLLVPPLSVAYAYRPALGWALGLLSLSFFLAVGAEEAHRQNYTGLVDFSQPPQFNSASK